MILSRNMLKRMGVGVRQECHDRRTLPGLEYLIYIVTVYLSEYKYNYLENVVQMIIIDVLILIIV